jgi:tRNA pseudouridine38-40 synthase
MKSYRLVIAYDGTDYHGWQRQPDAVTIAGTLENTFEHIFQKKITLIGASRTDAGVHALGQVALLKTDLPLPADDIKKTLNQHLPSDILIRSLEEVSNDFHPQANVLEKIYYYHFFTEKPLPFGARYGYYYRFPVDTKLLQECLQVFVGTHDFRSFCTGDEQESTVRTVNAIEVEYISSYQCYRIVVTGQSFLRYMIRRMVGAALEVASRSDGNPYVIAQALAKKNPLQKLPTAPSQGLLLRKIRYTK